MTANEPFYYNNHYGISEAIKTLNGFNQLIRDRGNAYYSNGERLNEFIVLGRYHLDTCGNFGTIQSGGKKYKIPAEIDSEIASVIPIEVWAAVHPELHFSIAFGSENIPSSSDVCPRCELGWSIDNVYDAERVWFNKEHRLFHRECGQTYLDETELEYFKKIFEAAGFKGSIFKQIENGYHGSNNDYSVPPWFYVKTTIGNFTIGWRKRVIHIDYSDNEWAKGFTKVDKLVRMHKRIWYVFEDVKRAGITVGSDYVHAYGDEKAIEYLNRLLQAYTVDEEDWNELLASWNP